MGIVQYGNWVIDVDVEKTKEYYHSYTVTNNQIYQNFIEYCRTMPEEERMFFNSLGINPLCCRPESLGIEKHEKFLEIDMYYYVVGKYVSYPEEDLMFVEELIDNDFNDSREDQRINIGIFQFDFQHPNHMIKMIPEDMPDGFICIQVSIEKMPWLLKEKCKTKMFVYPKWWQFIKRTKLKIINKKFRITSDKENCDILISLLNKNNINYEMLTKIKSKNLMKKWLIKLVNISLHDAKKFCAYGNKKYGNYLWHVFSFELVDCIVGKEASLKYDSIKKDKAYIILNNEKAAFMIDNLNNLSSEKINLFCDIIIFGQDFSWSYCHTHETSCGPYFFEKISVQKKG